MSLTQKTKKILETADKAKASNSGALQNKDRGLKTNALKWLKLMREVDDRKKEIEALREIIIDQVRPWHAEQCLESGEYTPTVLIETTEGPLQVLLQNKWGKIRAESEPELREVVGDAFEACFAPNVALALRKDVSRDPGKINEVIRELAAMAGERFSQWFETEQTLEPNEQFTQIHALKLGQETLDRLGLKQIIALSRKPA